MFSAYLQCLTPHPFTLLNIITSLSYFVCRNVSNNNLKFYFHNLLHFFQPQVNITTILGGGFILDILDIILDIIFEARLNGVATLSKEDKTNTPYHSNSSAAYEKIEALLNDFCPNNAYDVLVAIDDFVSEINYEAGYFNEKYYKQGFCDGVGLMKYMLTKNS